MFNVYVSLYVVFRLCFVGAELTGEGRSLPTLVLDVLYEVALVLVLSMAHHTRKHLWHPCN